MSMQLMVALVGVHHLCEKHAPSAQRRCSNLDEFPLIIRRAIDLRCTGNDFPEPDERGTKSFRKNERRKMNNARNVSDI